MEIKEKEFKIISVWACIGGLSPAQRDHVLTFVSLVYCCSSAFVLQYGNLTFECNSGGDIVEEYCSISERSL